MHSCRSGRDSAFQADDEGSIPFTRSNTLRRTDAAGRHLPGDEPGHVPATFSTVILGASPRKKRGRVDAALAGEVKGWGGDLHGPQLLMSGPACVTVLRGSSVKSVRLWTNGNGRCRPDRTIHAHRAGKMSC